MLAASPRSSRVRGLALPAQYIPIGSSLEFGSLVGFTVRHASDSDATVDRGYQCGSRSSPGPKSAAASSTSTPSPMRNASSNSDRADWDKAIGGSASVCDLVDSHRRSRRWPPTSGSPAVGPRTPLPQGTLLWRRTLAYSPTRRRQSRTVPPPGAAHALFGRPRDVVQNHLEGWAAMSSFSMCALATVAPVADLAARAEGCSETMRDALWCEPSRAAGWTRASRRRRTGPRPSAGPSAGTAPQTGWGGGKHVRIAPRIAQVRTRSAGNAYCSGPGRVEIGPPRARRA